SVKISIGRLFYQKIYLKSFLTKLKKLASQSCLKLKANSIIASLLLGKNQLIYVVV
ncbi:MAG: hypothetical protein US20_C0017G0014, partial [Candidatus Pacebacteria bacterium GW2011_GWF1_36_5]